MSDDDLVSALWFTSPAGNSGGGFNRPPRLLSFKLKSGITSLVLEEGQMNFYVDGNALEVEVYAESQAWHLDIWGTW